MNLPEPACELGYTREQIVSMFGAAVSKFDSFMNGQTMAICACQAFNHETRKYEPTSCKHEATTIYYPSDVDRFIRGLPVID